VVKQNITILIKPNSNKKRLSLNEIAQIDFDETKDLFKVILKKFTVKVSAVNSSRLIQNSSLSFKFRMLNLIHSIY